MKIEITPKEHKNISFLSCNNCDAKCCGSKIIYLTTADFFTVAKYFPIFFYVDGSNISLVYFFYSKEGNKCNYLKDNKCSIYENRPYACRTYPFSFDTNSNKVYMDNDCPEFGESNQFNLIKNNQVNPEITKEYINKDMIKYSKHIYGETNEYVEFCIKHQLIVPFKECYKDDKFNDFQVSFQDNLYVAYQPKVTIAMLKKKQIFNDNRFKEFLKAQLNSVSNNII